ncbi:OB-fold protein [Tenacibaculum jejuense]|uniref:tRNA_anti-like n=1 Tax=Tenacibaculum jejuense TaxID=584609 RepID=A0A238U4D1_9FLAO|nr:hypothetical protein [Tenacibaculum jejuense]SNR14069.1 conserved protein of unknown function [Tenacibaculum jejuense]
MAKRYSFLLKSVFLLVLGIFIYQAIFFDKSIKKTESEFTISADQLLKEFEQNETQSNKKYTNKIITIYGSVKNISHLNNRRTIILNNTTNSSIICDLDDKETTNINTIKVNQQLYIKGICKGYLKDVILLNCFLDTRNNHE